MSIIAHGSGKLPEWKTFREFLGLLRVRERKENVQDRVVRLGVRGFDLLRSRGVFLRKHRGQAGRGSGCGKLDLSYGQVASSRVHESGRVSESFSPRFFRAFNPRRKKLYAARSDGAAVRLQLLKGRLHDISWNLRG